MKRVWIALAITISVLATAALAQTPKPAQLSSGGPASKELKGSDKGHTYRVLLRARDAKGDGRKIAFSSASDRSIRGDWFLINGAQTYGFDGISWDMAPKGISAKQALEKLATEIILFQVWIDGKRITVPRRKHETMLQPDLTTVSAEFSKDGKKLIVAVSGSDGAGFWSAVWFIQKNGKVEMNVGGGG